MTKTVQVATAALGESHLMVVALQQNGSLWTCTVFKGQPERPTAWVKLPEIPNEVYPDDAMPMA